MKQTENALKRCLLLGWLALTIVLNLTAQTDETFRLRGIVMEESLQPLPFATIAITPLNGENEGEAVQQVTDDAGRFAVSLPRAERYRVEASYVGYTAEPMLKPYAEMKKSALLRFKMKEAVKEIGEVTVAVKRPLVRLDVDKLAYNVEEDPLSKNESLRDMLRRVPLVTVDGQGNVQVKGSSDFQIYLNGKPSSMINANPKDILQSIPAGSIKKVEVITDPGVKYDAEGVTAILNIVTNSGASFKGLAGSVFATVGYPFVLSAGSYLTAKFGKFGINSNYVCTYFKQKNNQSYESEEEFPSSFLINRGNTDRFNMEMHTGAITLTYDINPRNLLSLTTNFNFHKMNKYETLRGYSYTSKEQDALIYRDSVQNHSYNNRVTVESNLDYQWSGNTEGELLTVSYRYFYGPTTGKTTSGGGMYLSGKAPSIWQQRDLSKAGMHEHTAQADYSRPFAEKHAIEAGAKYIYRLGNTNPSYELYDPATDSWAPGSRFGQHLGIGGSPMNYVQTVLAAYTSYSFKANAWSLKAGLRLEGGGFSVKYATEPDANTRHRFTDLVPELSVGYNLSPSQQLKLNYTMRVRRPSMLQLNPYRSQVQMHRVLYGNADLLNERRNKLSLGYSLYKTKLSLNVSLDGSYVNKPITEVMFIDPQNPNVIVNTFENFGNRWSIRTNGFVYWSPLTWLRIISNFNVSYLTFNRKVDKTAANDISRISGVGGNVMIGSMITLPKDWMISLYLGRFWQEPTSYQEAFGSGYHSLVLNKTFLKKKLSVSLYVNNLFRSTYRFTIRQYTGAGQSVIHANNVARNFGINVSYSFGKMKSSIRKVQRTIENNDLSTESSGGTQQAGGSETPQSPSQN